jgi:putative DNA primase/helicase
VWDGKRWRTEDTLAATDLIRSVCRHAAVRADNPKVAAKLASSSTVGGVERLARADRRHAATTDEWDADPGCSTPRAAWSISRPAGSVHTTAPTG